MLILKVNEKKNNLYQKYRFKLHHIIDDLFIFFFFIHFCSILDLDFSLKYASFCLNHIFSTCVLLKYIIISSLLMISYSQCANVFDIFVFSNNETSQLSMKEKIHRM